LGACCLSIAASRDACWIHMLTHQCASSVVPSSSAHVTRSWRCDLLAEGRAAVSDPGGCACSVGAAGRAHPLRTDLRTAGVVPGAPSASAGGHTRTQTGGGWQWRQGEHRAGGVSTRPRSPGEPVSGVPCTNCRAAAPLIHRGRGRGELACGSWWHLKARPRASAHPARVRADPRITEDRLPAVARRG
jgi:hypothetical protein